MMQSLALVAVMGLAGCTSASQGASSFCFVCWWGEISTTTGEAESAAAVKRGILERFERNQRGAQNAGP